MKEFWWRRQQKQEDKSGHQLNHSLMLYNLLERTHSYRFEQPSTNHKKTRQSEEDKYRIIPHPRIAQTEMTDMCKHHENHCKPSHCIDIFYPLFCHFQCKITENSWNSCEFQQKMLLLHYEGTD